MALCMNGVGNQHSWQLSPNSAAVTQQLIEHFEWDAFDQVGYNPELEQSDFHLSPELKNWLGGQRFQSQRKFRPISHH